MNRIKKLFEHKNKNILSLYFTAGFPNLDDTVPILEVLQENEVDLVEIGIPYSDPLADGPIIQESSSMAIKNGMTLKLLFDQLKGIREKIQIPLILMGYLNPVLQYGVENFCKKCNEIGIDGVILPDLPLDIYQTDYQSLFERHGLKNIFLITPQTSDARIRQIDEISDAFIYMVSFSSITGRKLDVENQKEYFERIEKMSVKNPCLIGFGIRDKETFSLACKYAEGAIVGSGFINAISEKSNFPETIHSFVQQIAHEQLC